MISIAGVELETFERGHGAPILYLHGGAGIAVDVPFIDPSRASGASSLRRIPVLENRRCPTGSTAWTTSPTSIWN
jgi:hypothetical protein